MRSVLDISRFFETGSESNAAVPRYYFQLTDGLTQIQDSEGQVFADAAAAREHATACTDTFSRRTARFNGNAGLYWSVQVIDETGHQVFTLQLGAPVRSDSSRDD